MHLAGYCCAYPVRSDLSEALGPVKFEAKKKPRRAGLFLHSDDQSQLSAPPV